MILAVFSGISRGNKWEYLSIVMIDMFWFLIFFIFDSADFKKVFEFLAVIKRVGISKLFNFFQIKLSLTIPVLYILYKTGIKYIFYIQILWDMSAPVH